MRAAIAPMWCHRWTNFQGFFFAPFTCQQTFFCCSPSGQLLLNSLQSATSLSLRVEQVSYFNNALYLGPGICQASDARNATFTQSQDLCDSWHLCLIGMCIKVSCRHIVADLSLHYLQTCARIATVGVPLCVRVTRKLLASSLFIFKVPRLQSSLIVSQTVKKKSLSLCFFFFLNSWQQKEIRFMRSIDILPENSRKYASRLEYAEQNNNQGP